MKQTNLPGILDDHDRTIVRWLFRLLETPSVRSSIAGSEEMSAAAYALLRSKVTFPKAFEEFLGSHGADSSQGHGSIDRIAFEAWRHDDSNPFSGSVDTTWLRNFHAGLQMRGRGDGFATAFAEAIGDMAKELPPEREGWKPGADVMGGRVIDTSMRLPEACESLFHKHLDVMSLFAQWNDAERRVIELAYLLAHDLGLRLFFDLAQKHSLRWPALLAAVLDCEVGEIEQYIDCEGRLMRCGLVSIDPASWRVFPMDEFWHGWFSTPFKTLGQMFDSLVRPLVTKANGGAIGHLHPDDRAILVDLLARKWQECGCNALLYGARNIDKPGVVAGIIKDAGGKGYTLGKSIPERDMPSVAWLAQAYVARTDENGILVIPQADQVLTRTRRGTRQFAFFSLELDDDVSDSNADEALLSSNPARTLWLVNAPDRLSEDNLGRFLYVAQVKAASRAERRAEVDELLAPARLGSEFRQEMASHLRLGEQQLKSAVRLWSELSGRNEHSWMPEGVEFGGQSWREALVRRAIEQGQRALGRGDREHLRRPITQYSLDFLNVAGAFTVPDILHSLKLRPIASLCFHGLPGTGKTQLAEYIAVTLDRPILAKRASDLMNKYVGESEKEIRNMFTEAAEEDAILLLDEADSFLQDRSLAMHSWETACVNELLQGMERFRGTFICATNFFERVDRAALRRFTFKLEFLSLTEDQRWKMFCNEAGIDPAALSAQQIADWRQELLLTPYLTPGDFATVQRQCQLLGRHLTPQQWLGALMEEAKVKRDLMEAADKQSRRGEQGLRVVAID